MNFKSYLDNKYIGLIETKEKPSYNNEQVDKLLNDLNITLYRLIGKRNIKFDLTNEYKSPTEILTDIDEKKSEKITRRWMKFNEILEEIKEKHVDNL